MSCDMLNSREWRLDNLFLVVNEKSEKVKFRLRDFQRDLVNNLHYKNVLLKARQMGFTTMIALIGLDMAIFTDNFQMVMIAETKDKAEDIFYNKIIFPYDNLPQELKNFCPIVSKSSGEVVFGNGSCIKVMTSARSGTCNFLHVSEYGAVSAKFPQKSEEIKTGSFPAVHADGFIFVESTAMGMGGNYYDMVMDAEILQLQRKVLNKEEFKLFFFPWWRNKNYQLADYSVIIPERLLSYFDNLFKMYKIELTEEQMIWYTVQECKYKEKIWSEFPSYPQEAFKVSHDGSIFGVQFNKIHAENRVMKVDYDETLLVHTSWDLGIGDETDIWFLQFYGKEVRVIDYVQCNNEGLSYYAKILLQKDYLYGKHFAPHDIEVRELSDGISRRKKAEKMGIIFTVVPTNRDLWGGIEATRDLLNNAYFDKGRCEKGILKLQNYKKKWNDKFGVYSNTPQHDDNSHAADSLRTIAVAINLNMLNVGVKVNGFKVID